MPRPQVTVNISEEAPRRGAPTDTGTALWAFSAGALPAKGPVVCYSAADAAAAFPEPPNASVVQWVGDYLTTSGGVGGVVLTRAASAGATTTDEEWAAALDQLGEDYGPGQVSIPGVTTTAATAALAAHVTAHGYRSGLVEAAQDVDADDALTVSSGLSGEDGAPRLIPVVGWVGVSAPAGTQRLVPASVLTAGLVARNDAVVGHANNSPAADQGRGAGIIRQGLSVSTTFTDAERDALNDGGVSVIRMRQGVPTLYGWRSASTSPLFRQAAAGRFTMMLDSGVAALLEQFVERQVDAGGLYAEVDAVLRDYYSRLWAAGALYGTTADEAFRLEVASVNTTRDAAQGVVRAQSLLRITRSAELIEHNVAVTTAEGSVAA